MSRGTRKTLIFVVEGMNSFATVFYAYYIFFYMQERFGFENRHNLALAACYGGVYTIAAWCGGHVAQRWGLARSLRLGFVIMPVTLLLAAHVNSASGQIGMMVLYVIGMCFTWPALEALVSEGESSEALPRFVGIYNLVWSGTGAVSYFAGGFLLERLGLKSIFYVPAIIHVVELVIALGLSSSSGQVSIEIPAHKDESAAAGATARTRSFLKMAWLANPFAYIAINTLVAVVPGIAAKFALSPRQAGFYCSIWCFARFVSFALLWFWPGWHYRFRWLLAGYLGLVISFTSILAAPTMHWLVMMQIVFGCAAGLIYYSSLFYSMDRTDTHGQNGGIHEAAIGLGNFVGPAVGSASLYLGSANSAVAVGGLLVIGLGGLLWLNRQGQARRRDLTDNGSNAKSDR